MRVGRLAPLDALFLGAETPVKRLHVMAIIVLDPSTVPDGYRFEHLRDHIGDRLRLVPPLRRRLVHVPLGLDPNRPLWEMHVVEGLGDGHIAIVAKLHHALMDGMAGIGFMASLFSFTPEPPEPPEPPPRVPCRGRTTAGPAGPPRRGAAVTTSPHHHIDHLLSSAPSCPARGRVARDQMVPGSGLGDVDSDGKPPERLALCADCFRRDDLEGDSHTIANTIAAPVGRGRAKLPGG